MLEKYEPKGAKKYEQIHKLNDFDNSIKMLLIGLLFGLSISLSSSLFFTQFQINKSIVYHAHTAVLSKQNRLFRIRLRQRSGHTHHGAPPVKWALNGELWRYVSLDAWIRFDTAGGSDRPSSPSPIRQAI